MFDYLAIVSHPMDLGTIRRNLVRGLYGTASELRAHVGLVFSNAFLYNPVGSPEREKAAELEVMRNAVDRNFTLAVLHIECWHIDWLLAIKCTSAMLVLCLAFLQSLFSTFGYASAELQRHR